jgi:hypothetical protein
LWAARRDRKRLREAATRAVFLELGGRERLEWILVLRLRTQWEEILGRRLSDKQARDQSRELAESMAAQWPSVHMTPDIFIDYSIEQWAQALREKVSLNWLDFIAVPAFVCLFTQMPLTNEAGLHWWQALPISIPSAALTTIGWHWARRKGYADWEDAA